MDPEQIVNQGDMWFWIIGVIALFIGVRIVAGILDKQRIESEISGKGGQVDSIRWTPFAKGWLGSKNERLYEVKWTDSSEVQHRATVKTAMLAGNYFADSVTSGKGADHDSRHEGADLLAENQRLKRENEQLRREVEQLRKDRI
jgi:hypothetical protein